MQTPTKNFGEYPKFIVIIIIVVLIHIARDENAGAKVCGELSKELNVTNIKYHQLDITSQESINKLRDHVMEKFGGLDVLINNSGVLLKVIQNFNFTYFINFFVNWTPEDVQSNKIKTWEITDFNLSTLKKIVLKVKLC